MQESDSRRFRSGLGLLLALLAGTAAVVALALALAGLAAAAPAVPHEVPEGLGEAWTLTGATIIDPMAPCAENGLLLDTEEVLTSAIPFIQETIISAGDQVYMAERLLNNFGGTGSSSVLVYAADDLGIVNASFPLPADIP